MIRDRHRPCHWDVTATAAQSSRGARWGKELLGSLQGRVRCLIQPSNGASRTNNAQRCEQLESVTDRRCKHESAALLLTYSHANPSNDIGGGHRDLSACGSCAVDCGVCQMARRGSSRAAHPGGEAACRLGSSHHEWQHHASRCSGQESSTSLHGRVCPRARLGENQRLNSRRICGCGDSRRRCARARREGEGPSRVDNS